MKKKTLIVKPTKKQLEVMKLFWGMLQQEQNLFYTKVGELEKNMSERVGIEGLEFFQCDNDFVGIGNYERTMKLIQREDLERVK
jgi:hypothetical protein